MPELASDYAGEQVVAADSACTLHGHAACFWVNIIFSPERFSVIMFVLRYAASSAPSFGAAAAG